jgi:hypothetical protein
MKGWYLQMSKKTNTPAAVDATPAALNLQTVLSNYPGLSLRKVAQVTEVSYPRLLKASKAPVAGQPYDPEATNFEALQQIFDEKKIDFSTYDWAELERQAGRPEGMLAKDMERFTVSTPVWLRRNNEKPYIIVYKTKEQIVLQLEGSEELICWSHSTFLLNGPIFQPRKVAENEGPAFLTQE